MCVIMPSAYLSPADRWVGPVLLLALISVTVGKHCWHSSCILGVICKQEAVLRAGQLPGDTCSPRDASEDRAVAALQCRAQKSQAGVHGAAACDNKPTGLREILGIPAEICWVFHAGAEVVWCCRGTELDNLSSHRRDGQDAKALLLSGLFQPQGFSSLTKEVRES